MTRYSNPIAVSPWTGRLHLALTLLLVVAAAGVAGLASAGKVKFGEAGKSVAPEDGTKTEDEADGGRYQIEQVNDARDFLNRAGKNDFFGTTLVDAWVFKYKGGMLEVKLETDFDGETFTAGTVPDDWKLTLHREESHKKDPNASLNRTGYLLVCATRPSVSLSEALSPYHVHIGGLMAFGSLGPINLLPTLFLEVHQPRLYRIFLSAAPPSDVSAGGFNRWDEQSIRIRSPLVARDPATEKATIGGGKDLKPNKEVLLLDRERGYSSLRLKARFLGDGEVRDLLPK